MYNEVQLLVRNGSQAPGAEWGLGRLVEGNGNPTTGQVGQVPDVHPLLYLHPSSTDTGKEMPKVLTHERLLSISPRH